MKHWHLDITAAGVRYASLNVSKEHWTASNEGVTKGFGNNHRQRNGLSKIHSAKWNVSIGYDGKPSYGYELCPQLSSLREQEYSLLAAGHLYITFLGWRNFGCQSSGRQQVRSPGHLLTVLSVLARGKKRRVATFYENILSLTFFVTGVCLWVAQ